MTLLEATGRYWRCSRILRGHSFGTPQVAEQLLASLEESDKLKALAKANSESRYAEPKACKVIDAFSYPPIPDSARFGNHGERFPAEAWPPVLFD